jgi:thioredoxin reductase
MKETVFDVIIIGGSYSGLAAGLALGRSLRKVLIIDSGRPCNRQTPHSHNFLTQDGKTPAEIASLAKLQVEMYSTVRLVNGLVNNATKMDHGFLINTAAGDAFTAKKLIFATGIRDILPDIAGIAECWGISVLHCPYCHGYEIRNKKTGILLNGETGFEFTMLISNWTKDLRLFTNGRSELSARQTEKLKSHGIDIFETEIEKLEHTSGQIQKICFWDGSEVPVEALYAPGPFEQHCMIPETLGCELTGEGYILTDAMQKTSIHGIYACGDNTTRIRTVAKAVAMGTTAGMMVNKEIVFEEF